MKKFYLFVWLVLMLVSATVSCSRPKATHYSKAYKDSLLIDVNRYIGFRMFDSAWIALEHAEQIAYDYPTIPFMKAALLYEDGQEEVAKPEVARSLFIHDSLLSIRPSFSDAMNKSICIQFLYGKEAYKRSLDSIRNSKEYQNDINGNFPYFYDICVEDIFEAAVYNHYAWRDSSELHRAILINQRSFADAHGHSTPSDSMKYLLQVFEGDNLQSFPEFTVDPHAFLSSKLGDSKASGEQTVRCEFFLTSEGKMRYIHILDEDNKVFRKELIRAFSSFPNMKPARRDGKAVSCYCRVWLVGV